jgi:hypothetical protein
VASVEVFCNLPDTTLSALEKSGILVNCGLGTNKLSFSDSNFIEMQDLSLPLEHRRT